MGASEDLKQRKEGGLDPQGCLQTVKGERKESARLSLSLWHASSTIYIGLILLLLVYYYSTRS